MFLEYKIHLLFRFYGKGIAVITEKKPPKILNNHVKHFVGDYCSENSYRNL